MDALMCIEVNTHVRIQLHLANDASRSGLHGDLDGRGHLLQCAMVASSLDPRSECGRCMPVQHLTQMKSDDRRVIFCHTFQLLLP